MSDATPPPPVSGTARLRGGRPSAFSRWTRRTLAVVVAVVAALLVAGFSIDLGPLAKARAEREASKFLERPMHIGRLSALLRPGEFALDDVVIEGLTKDARPYLTAKRIVVSVPWWTLLESQLVVEVRMTDWTMVVETWAGGKHNMPKLTPRNRSRAPTWYRTTVPFVYADRGEFTYDDHATPWRVVARNLNVDLVRAYNLASYVGTARFTNGTIQIQNFLPMRADLSTRFTLDGSIVHLHQIDLVTDGARSIVKGDVDFAHWPEQRYEVDSRVDLSRMREIFFANEKWTLLGQGRFKGVFHLFSGGRELRGTFASDLAGVYNLRFPNLRGSLAWLPTRFEITQAESDFYGGSAKFDYSLDPLNSPQGSTATFNFGYAGVELDAVGRAYNWDPLRLTGRATGRNSMQWPSGHFSTEVHGEGEGTVAPPDGVALAAAVLPALAVAIKAPPDQRAVTTAPREPFDKNKSISPLAVGGHVTYRFDANGLDLDESWAASSATYVSFHGRTAYRSASTETGQTNIPFHVTSTNWQESDRVLVAIMREFGSQASAIEVGGRGTFDGVLTQSFVQPRIEGKFAGESMRAWDVTWGRATGDLVIQDKYVDIANSVIGDSADATIHADGRFSLGYPRQDAGEEIHAHVCAEHWPLKDFRHAFQQDEWPVDGVATADITLTGPYERPFGSGELAIDHGVAWRETFDRVTGAMQFEGIGLRISKITLTKGPALAHGVMWIGWDKTYSFDADGDHLPIESLTRFKVPRAPLSGVLRFTASGTGAFASPTYAFQGTVADLFAGDEGIGQVTGKLVVHDNVVTIDYLEAASNRLQLSGSGNIALNEFYDADMSFRFSNTSIDPYVKFLAPQISPYTRLVASGAVRVAGELINPAELLVDATVDDAKLTLLDYDLHNDGPIRLKLEQDVVSITRLKLAGTGTSLELLGEVPLANAPMSLTATGEASLAILQGFGSLKYVSSSGTAALSARVEGYWPDPVFSGYADIKDGRIRHTALPRSLENINGRITLSASDINIDQLHAQVGSGDVRFGGVITLKGFVPDEFNLTAVGTAMQLRYPQGFESTVNAHLALSGPIASPTLSGRVDLVHAIYTRQLESDMSLLGGLAGGGGATEAAVGPGPASDSGFPLTFDIQIQAPPLAFIDRKDAKIEGHVDSLIYRGTIDRPTLTGRIDIDRGEWFFAGNRYSITRGSIDFLNPAKIEPYFQIEAETRLRASGQTYVVTIQLNGTFDHLTPSIRSDPPLPFYDILSLMVGETPDVGRAEQRALLAPQEAQAQAVRTAAAQVLFSPLSSRVGSVFEKTVALDTVQISPLLGNEATLQQLGPGVGARLTLGKRISSRAFLTYSRALNSTQLEVIVLEYTQSDRVSWVLSRNEDHTFALDFRIRHVF